MMQSAVTPGRTGRFRGMCGLFAPVIAWLVTLAVMVTGFAPLLLAPLIMVLGMALIGFIVCRGGVVGKLQLPDHLFLLLLSFGLWGALSSLWALKPSVALEKGVLFLALVFFVHLYRHVMPSFAEDTRRRTARGILVAYAVALLFPLFEYSTGFAFLNTVASRFPDAIGRLEGGRVADFYLNRQVNLLALFVWPVLLLVPVFWRDQRRHVYLHRMAIVTVLLVVLLKTASQTAQAAAIIGGLAFIAARFAAGYVDRIARILWVIAVLGIVPIVMGLHALGMQNWQNVPASFRDRIHIWNYAAERISEHPLFGVGIRSQRYMSKPESERQTVLDGQLHDHLGHHNHNAFLEIWYQLGVVGALLLLPVGLFLLARISALQRPIQPYAYAALAGVCVTAAFGYGFWQSWLLAAYAWLAILMLVAADYSIRAETKCQFEVLSGSR